MDIVLLTMACLVLLTTLNAWMKMNFLQKDYFRDFHKAFVLYMNKYLTKVNFIDERKHITDIW